MKIKHNGEAFEDCAAADLRIGDKVLVKYYDEHGEWTEELWTANAIHQRRYGAGIRYTVDWSCPDYNGKTTDTYGARAKLARVTA